MIPSPHKFCLQATMQWTAIPHVPLAGCSLHRVRRTRKPRTGLPPGSLQTRGTAITLVRSSQTVSISPSSPWGTSGRGSLSTSDARLAVTYVRNSGRNCCSLLSAANYPLAMGFKNLLMLKCLLCVSSACFGKLKTSH